MKLALIGYGKMGQRIGELANDRGHEIVATISSGEELENWSPPQGAVAIEFTRPDTCVDNLTKLLEKKVPTVVGTTGWYQHRDEIEQKFRENQVGFLASPNFSLGVNLFGEILNQCASKLQKAGYAPALHEVHHVHKKDAPSGTALWLAQQTNFPSDKITDERTGEVCGFHEMTFDSEVDTIKLSHNAKNRDGFCLGSILVAEWLQEKNTVHTMAEFLEDFVGE